jgi:hypothetical protein
MTGAPVRDPLADHLLTPQNAASFAALDALREGYEVYPVTDAIAGTTPEAHRAGLERVIQAGGSRSPGSRSRASCSATGAGRTRPTRSPRSFSLSGYGRSSSVSGMRDRPGKERPGDR